MKKNITKYAGECIGYYKGKNIKMDIFFVQRLITRSSLSEDKEKLTEIEFSMFEKIPG